NSHPLRFLRAVGSLLKGFRRGFAQLLRSAPEVDYVLVIPQMNNRSSYYWQASGEIVKDLQRNAIEVHVTSAIVRHETNIKTCNQVWQFSLGPPLKRVYVRQTEALVGPERYKVPIRMTSQQFVEYR